MPLAIFTIGDRTLELRRATLDDLTAIVELLADDPLGSTREAADPADLRPYREAFAQIDGDRSHLLLVATEGSGVAATAQLSFLPGLARRGATRAQIEAVRVDRRHRGAGLGEAMIRWMVDEARRRHCRLVQLTSDKSRRDAHRFYERIGFSPTHEGFKLDI